MDWTTGEWLQMFLEKSFILYGLGLYKTHEIIINVVIYMYLCKTLLILSHSVVKAISETAFSSKELSVDKSEF